MVKRFVAAMCILVILSGLTGCWGKTELNDIGIVVATGVDLEKDGSIRITVMSVQPEGASSAPITRSFTWIGTATGSNLVDASKNLRNTSMKKLSWLHNSIIIAGEDIARANMEEVVDFFSRNREVRFNSYIMIAEGTAFDLMQTPADILSNLPKELLGLIDNVDDWSKSYVANAKEFLVSYSEHCGDLVTGRIFTRNERRTTFSTDREDYEKLDLRGEEIQVACLEGSAVFKSGNMVGWLDGRQTRGYLWITNKIKSGAIIADGDGGKLAFENMFTKTSVTMEVNGDDIIARVKVDTRGVIVEQTSNENLIDESILSDIETGFADVIRSEMEDAVKKIQIEYNADVLRFGSNLNKSNPAEWKKVMKDWENTIFAKVKVKYEVKVTVERTGKIFRALF